MTSYIEFVGVFVCGALFGAAIAIHVLEMYGMVHLRTSPAGEEAAIATGNATGDENSPDKALRPAKKLKRRTPWRKVKAQYEAEHRRTRQSVEERVQEMEGR